MDERRLLVLDDDPEIGRTIALISELAAVPARFTQDPQQFFDLIEEWRPTHIALDLVMPRMDGVEVMVQLAQRGCSARVIITSGVGSRVLDAAGRSAREHGLDIAGVLSKPFSPAALRGLLEATAHASVSTSSARPRAAQRDVAAAGSPAPLQVTQASLLRALDDDEFVLHYQPKVACASGTLAGFEALLRWNHPVHGLVMPSQFIQVAEQSTVIDALTERVLEIALPWLARTFPGGRAPHGGGSDGTAMISLSVNISARTLHDMQLADQIAARCADAGVDRSRLILELTETSAMEDPVASLDLLTRLRMKGFQLSIDDFGTGFSSMVQLVRLPFSEMKVDRSFVMTAAHSQESRAVIKSIVELGHSLGLSCTAEGVEDEQALEYLRSVGCDLAQGYLIARPMPAEDVLGWMQSNPRIHPPGAPPDASGETR